MTIANNEADLQKIFVRVFQKPIDEIRSWNYDSVPEWDSLAQISLVIQIEEHWEMSIQPDAIPYLENFNDFLNYVNEKSNK